jgi:hypothetical protein
MSDLSKQNPADYGGSINNKEDNNEASKLQGILAVTQNLWDYERQEILRVLGVRGSINPRAWSTEALVAEIKDCVDGNKILHGQQIQETALPVTSVVELATNDPELLRAWKRFPDPVADNHGYTWEYIATELICEQWVHIFSHDLHPVDNQQAYARVPARAGWAPKF